MSDECLVCLVRHGATSWNEAGKFQGRRDIPLIETGIVQARRAGAALADRAKEFGFPRWEALYTSPLARARQTAVEVGRWLGLKPQAVAGLMERSFGALEGLTRAEAELAYPNWWEHPGTVPGLESENELRQRALRTLCELAQAHPGEAFVVVTHGGFINGFLREIGAKKPDEGWKPLHNGGLTFVAGQGRSWRLLRLNQGEHLIDETVPASEKGR